MAAPTEAQIVAQVVVRLQARLPGVALQVVEEAVAVLFSSHQDSKVRDFLPVLVEREAFMRLRTRSGSDVA